MGIYATMQQMGVSEAEERRDGIYGNSTFISYFLIESVLYSFPKVLEAGVIVENLKGENEKLKIYLALEEAFTSDEERENYCQKVKEFIGRKFFLEVKIDVLIRDKLPMTRSGKILRSILLDY